MELEFPPTPRPQCPLCDHEGFIIHESLKDPIYDAPGEWGYRTCGNQLCGHIWIDPIPHPTDLARAYSRYYTQQAAGGSPSMHIPARRMGRAYLQRRYGYRLSRVSTLNSILAMAVRGFPRLIARLDDWVGHLACDPNGTLLEIGCGNGEFLQTMKELGWNVTGVETDPKAAAIAHAYGLDVHQCDIGDANLPENRFSAIVLRHVIEHIVDPQALLRQCFTLLRPNGLLVITTPNPDGVGHRLFGGCWRGLEPPRHVHLFRPGSLSQCMLRTGFSGVDCRSTLHWSYGILQQSTMIRFPFLYKTRLGRYMVKGLGLVVSQIEVFLQWFGDGHGEELLFVARKPAA